MKKSYDLICMSFDGDYVTEMRGFEDIQSAWDRSSDMGSRWFFYPFHFVVTPGGTIADTPNMQWLKGKRLKTVRKMFKYASERDETQGFDPDMFAFYLWDMYGDKVKQ